MLYFGDVVRKNCRRGEFFPDIFLVPYQAPTAFLLSNVLCSLVLPSRPTALSSPVASCLVL